MLFNSLEFLFVFLPITFIVYFGLNKAKLIKLAVGWLVCASLFFYAFWNIKYLVLILCSMIFNYTIGYTLSHPTSLKINRKAVFIFGLLGNLALLCYFKYFNFLITNINLVLHTGFDTLKIALPLGISFFTFTQIAYLSDAYKKEVQEYDFLNYALFVTFFPHLIAGPILHHSEMMPQFANLRKKIINHKNIAIGMFLLAIGLFKKVLIADNLSPFVHLAFDTIPTLSFWESHIGALSYTFQLYFDFSGYCDMALGIGYLFNIVLPINFNSPYKANNIQDFWHRWHITLSRFLKNYIYIPLGGNRQGEISTYRNLFLTFLIGGIWHGANFTFIAWGILHGIASVIHRFWKNFYIVNRLQPLVEPENLISPFLPTSPAQATSGIRRGFVPCAVPRSGGRSVCFQDSPWGHFLRYKRGSLRHLQFNNIIAIVTTFIFINTTWVFFRSPSIHRAFDILKSMCGFNGFLPISVKKMHFVSEFGNEKLSIILFLSCFILVFLFKNSIEFTKMLKPNKICMIITMALLIISILSLNTVSEFLYFQF